MDTRTSPIRLRLERVREVLEAEHLEAVLVPSSDPHLSEYLPERWQGRQWLSGFTGSMGTLVVTLQDAAIFADSRYWVQAESELAGTGINLVKAANGGAGPATDWIIDKLQATQGVIGVDGAVLGLATAEQLILRLKTAGLGVRTDVDMLAAVWPERPGLPDAPVYEHVAPQAGRSRAERLQLVRSAMRRLQATHHFISTVDDIAWLFNLRGCDVPYNPVFLAHALIELETATLFVAEGKVSDALGDRLKADAVHLAPYAAAGSVLSALPDGSQLLIDPKRVTYGLRQQVPDGDEHRVKVIQQINPSTLLKSRKTAADAAHIREAMIEDGAAMCEFYAWFEAALADPAQTGLLTELTVDEHLSAARGRRAGFVGLSFPVIAGFNANGAMPHYRATAESHAIINPANGAGGLLLIDSGGQYLGGTTDVTRVWPIGEVSEAQRRDYTRVLKGTLSLSRTRFPVGTLSPMLDGIARAPLWQHGLDYGHGTGHGVGYFLNVHEGPQSISKAVPDADMAMQPGMVTSIEPGLYRPGQWGIRIENLVLNVPATFSDDGGETSDVTSGVSAFGDFLEFETLTLCPIDTRCIERSLLSDEDIAWLNAYHATVFERLSPRVSGAVLAWLTERTRAL
jgi:Xaa-Pro aminopeptidase